jgi:hypothetical protein
VSLSQGDACLSCPGSLGLSVLLPHLAGVIVEAVTPAAGLLLVTARARAPRGRVPGVRDRVAPGPQPLLQDAGRRRGRGPPSGDRAGGPAVLLHGSRLPAQDVRRAVDGLTTRYARKTPLLAGMLESIAVALAGRAGSRLASALGVPASRQVLLRLIMAAPDPAAAGPRCSGSMTSRSGAASTTARCSST